MRRTNVLIATMLFICIFLTACGDGAVDPSNETINGEFSGMTDKNKDVYLSIVNNNVDGYIYLVMDPTAAGAANTTLKATMQGKISSNNFQLTLKGDGLAEGSFINGKINGNTISGDYFATGIIFTFDVWGNLVSSFASSSGSQWSCNKK